MVLTNAFGKKIGNFEAIALNFCYYTIVKTHGAHDERTGYVTDLEIPPVDSALRDVQVQIVKNAKSRK